MHVRNCSLLRQTKDDKADKTIGKTEVTVATSSSELISVEQKEKHPLLSNMLVGFTFRVFYLFIGILSVSSDFATAGLWGRKGNCNSCNKNRYTPLLLFRSNDKESKFTKLYEGSIRRVIMMVSLR